MLIVVLVLAVVFLVVVSLLASSVTDIAITSREDEALRAFSAAEAGIEKALLTGTISSQTFETSSYTGTVAGLGQNAKTYNFPSDIRAGDVATLWFVAHGADEVLSCSGAEDCFTGSKMKVCWGANGTSDSSSTPALEASVFYAVTPADYSTILVARSAQDPNTSRRGSNSFDAPDGSGCTINDKQYAFTKTLDFAALGIPQASYSVENGLLFAQLRFLYNTNIAQPVGVDFNFPGNGSLPAQGLKIQSVGISGESTRKLEVNQLFSELPAVFDYSLFAPGGLTK